MCERGAIYIRKKAYHSAHASAIRLDKRVVGDRDGHRIELIVRHEDFGVH
jgi:hypothetical protein